jgi:murein DD-endopeptidase MepM/ murein hydrolase activator NlpD
MKNRKLFGKRPWPLASCLALLTFLCLSGLARAGGMVDVQAPSSVGRGKAFMVRIGTWYPLDDLEVRWNGKSVHPAVVKTGERSEAVLLLGVGLRGDTGTYPLEVVAHIWGHERRFFRTIEVGESEWGTETLSVPPKMVRPPASEQARIEKDREMVRAALALATPERYWTAPLSRPVKGKMLSRFGLYRTFNGNVASRHTGLDFRAWLGTPIRAVAAGKVVLTRHLYYGGNTVIIDHGNGFLSMSCHLSKTKVKEGAMVEAGQVVGLSGATGRVTGAHLHLAVFVLGAVVDPEPFFAGTFSGEVNEK